MICKIRPDFCYIDGKAVIGVSRIEVVRRKRDVVARKKGSTGCVGGLAIRLVGVCGAEAA